MRCDTTLETKKIKEIKRRVLTNATSAAPSPRAAVASCRELLHVLYISCSATKRSERRIPDSKRRSKPSRKLPTRKPEIKKKKSRNEAISGSSEDLSIRSDNCAAMHHTNTYNRYLHANIHKCCAHKRNTNTHKRCAHKRNASIHNRCAHIAKQHAHCSALCCMPLTQGFALRRVSQLRLATCKVHSHIAFPFMRR